MSCREINFCRIKCSVLTWSCFILRDEVRRSAFCASSSFSISFFWFLLDVSKSNSYFLSKSYKTIVTLALFELQDYTMLLTKLNKRDEYCHPHQAHLPTSWQLNNWWDHVGCTSVSDQIDRVLRQICWAQCLHCHSTKGQHIFHNIVGDLVLGVQSLPERVYITRWIIQRTLLHDLSEHTCSSCSNRCSWASHCRRILAMSSMPCFCSSRWRIFISRKLTFLEKR